MDKRLKDGPQYSGPRSRVFWKRVNRLEEHHGELYALGIALQNLEGQVLNALYHAEQEEQSLKKSEEEGQ